MKSELKKLKDNCWKLCSLYIRQSAADQNGYAKCYTCGTVKLWKELQAGHGIGGRTNAILFESKIIKPQCQSCNIGRGGNYEVFVMKLIKEIGLEEYERILQLKRQPKKFTLDELENLQDYFTTELELLDRAMK